MARTKHVKILRSGRQTSKNSDPRPTSTARLTEQALKKARAATSDKPVLVRLTDDPPAPIAQMAVAAVDGDEKVFDGLVFYTMFEWWCTQKQAAIYGDKVTARGGHLILVEQTPDVLEPNSYILIPAIHHGTSKRLIKALSRGAHDTVHGGYVPSMVSTTWIDQCLEAHKVYSPDCGEPMYGPRHPKDRVIPQEYHGEYIKLRDAARLYDWRDSSKSEFYVYCIKILSIDYEFIEVFIRKYVGALMDDCQEFALAATINVGPKIKPMSLEGRADMYLTGQDHTNRASKPPTVTEEDTTHQDKCLGNLGVSEVSLSLEKTEAVEVDLDLNLKQSTPAEADAEAETETEKESTSCVWVSLDIADLDAWGEAGTCAKDSKPVHVQSKAKRYACEDTEMRYKVVVPQPSGLPDENTPKRCIEDRSVDDLEEGGPSLEDFDMDELLRLALLGSEPQCHVLPTTFWPVFDDAYSTNSVIDINTLFQKAGVPADVDLSKDDYIIPILQDGIWSAISVILSTNQLTTINFNGKDQVCVDVEKRINSLRLAARCQQLLTNGKMAEDDPNLDISVESPVVAQTANDLVRAELEMTSIERPEGFAPSGFFLLAAAPCCVYQRTARVNSPYGVDPEKWACVKTAREMYPSADMTTTEVRFIQN